MKESWKEEGEKKNNQNNAIKTRNTSILECLECVLYVIWAHCQGNILQIWQVSLKFRNSLNISLGFISIPLLTCIVFFYQKEVVTSDLKECVK